MAMYDVKFKSFKEIEAYWRGVKPIRGRKEDVRPIADRARHWERVNKLSNTCYSMSLSFWNGEIHNVIKWELVSGVETVTIANGIGEWAHTSHYSFLDRFLPWNVFFRNRSGKHFISTNQNGLAREKFLPKGTGNWKAGRGYEYDEKQPVVKLTRTDTSHDWEFTGDDHTIPRARVDKEAKKIHKKAISDFCEWTWNMLPLLEDNTPTNWQERRDKCSVLGINAQHTSHRGTHDNKLFLSILATPDDPLYADLAIECIAQLKDTSEQVFDYQTRTWNHNKLRGDVKTFRRKLNIWVNKQGGFTNITTDY